MTEQEWLDCTNPTHALDFLLSKSSDRRLRLFTCACCRRVWHLMTYERIQNAVVVTERYADGLASESEMHEAQLGASIAARQVPDGEARRVAFSVYYMAAKECWASVFTVGGWWKKPDLIRDVFGNLFRPVAVPSDWLAWNDSTVVRIAQAIYDERAFDRMPILADALEDAGCADEHILSHCRSVGPHVRGCHVLDALLGKE